MTDTTPVPVVDLSGAPLPTGITRRRRRNLVIQAGSFAVFNARMLRMVVKERR